MTATTLQLRDLTGIRVIDDQHQEIFALIGSLEITAADGDRKVIGRHIDHILSLTLSHFEFEEELMEQASYPFLKVHKRLHDHFMQRFIAYTHRFDSGEDVTEELVPFLSSWLQNHFRQEDKDYSPQILAEISGQAEIPRKASNENWLQQILGK